MNDELSAQTRVVSKIRLELQLADEAYAAAGKAAESMAVPTATAGTAVAGLGRELKAAGGEANRASDEFQRLYDRLFPFEAAMRQLQADEMLLNFSVER